MVKRIYVEKKPAFRQEAEGLREDLAETLGIKPAGLRIINRYDVEHISDRTMERAAKEVFSEPQVDDILPSLPPSQYRFAVCYLPGQYDQRAESAKQCIAFLSPSESVKVKSAKVYLLDGITKKELEAIGKYVVNPVEAMLDSLDACDTLDMETRPVGDVKTLDGFLSLDGKGLEGIISAYGLAMDKADLAVFQHHFQEEKREPTLSELKVCDTYWSDHCRHTTFLTRLDNVTIEDEKAKKGWERYQAIRKELGRTKEVTLMDVATIGAKYLASKGKLPDLDVSKEINACSINRTSKVDGKEIPILLMFKNETHNHPTEIEPFGGAATCIGGAIRDPLSGRAYVYQAMRVSGAGDPTVPFGETMRGKLPQKKLVVTAAAGNSSYGNQIGLATSLVDEMYHEGYLAKHMELGAVIAAVPKGNVRREEPIPGDVVILVGGRTGRDGVGGATGSSKSHKSSSLATCGAEVQKGNAPEERKLQRLLRDKETALMIKRCNDFGAGGVSVAIGELADGLSIDLDKVPKKYAGLDGTEIAISESQERMAFVVGKEDAERFLRKAEAENLEATPVAVVTEKPFLEMWWRGKRIVSLSRSFLDLNGAKRKTDVVVEKPRVWDPEGKSAKEALGELEYASRQGLCERFDSTIGAGSVMLPFGGRTQKTPTQAMSSLIPTPEGRSDTASLMSYGCDPNEEDHDPYQGSYDAVVESLSRLIASGSPLEGTYLSLQEYFGKTGDDPVRWGRPLAALLGALDAQIDLGVAAIGGKDSMSGTFEKLDVPNTLVSFAVNTVDADRVLSPEFKEAGSIITLVVPTAAMREHLLSVERTLKGPDILSAATVVHGNLEAQLAKCCFGNMVGLALEDHPLAVPAGSFLIESRHPLSIGKEIARTEERPLFGGQSLSSLLDLYEAKLESVYPLTARNTIVPVKTYSKAGRIVPYGKGRIATPKVLIPVFPGTNCETDSETAWKEAGADTEVFVVNTLSTSYLEESIRLFADKVGKSQILFIPGGFSGGDEPDGSGKFITSFLRNAAIRDQIMRLLKERDGLVGGICNGFQALMKLGLVPYGEFREMTALSPTLTFNTLKRHISHLARTRVSSNSSPWLSRYRVGEVQMVPISHGEGRFVCPKELLDTLADNGQIATQYVDDTDKATMDGRWNLNGSYESVEGITSPDGHVFGRMAHVERCDERLYRNVRPSSGLKFFQGAVGYFV